MAFWASSSSAQSPSQSPSLQLKAVHDHDDEHYYDVGDSFEEDVCSICLESFTTQDPSTVTCCKHEYHLQCILEWTQRSKECPICWQDLVLKDSYSQELLAAVKSERNLRARPRFHEDQTHNSREERQYSSYGVVVGESSNSNIPSIGNVKPSLPVDPSAAGTTVSSSTVNSMRPRIPARKKPIDSPQRSCPTGLSFSKSMKLRFSVASSRCKESISKGTRGFKDKLLVRKGVQREVKEGIAGVAKVKL